MARRILLSLIILFSAGAAWVLRALQLSQSYEPETSLPLPLDQWGWALWGGLGAVALLTLLLTIPEKNGKDLSAYRPVVLGAILQGGGALLLAAGGAWQLYQLYPALCSMESVPAMLMLLAALGLFGGMKACFGGKSKAGVLLLLSMCAACIYLVLTYLEISSDPILRHFEMRMLSIGAATLAVTALCSLAFGAGGRRWFLLLSALTVPLSAAALYTSDSYAQALGFVGCALAAFGFFLSVLFGVSQKGKVQYELVDDPFRTGSVHRRVIREAEEQQAAAAAEVSAVSAAAPLSAEEKQPAEQTADQPEPLASPPSSAPAEEADGFDLSRVDRLLRELEEEKNSN